MTTTSSSSTSSPISPLRSQQPVPDISSDDKIRICQRLGVLFELSVNTTEQACFEAAWEKCKARDWTLLKGCQEDLNHIVNEQGRSLLQQAIRIGEIALATEMIANGIAIHTRDAVGNTAMHYAVQTESLHLVSMLYGHIPQDAQNFYGQTPLHFAAARGQLDIIRTLIENGANLSASTQVPINVVNSQASLSIGDLTLPNLTPLAFAVIRGDRDCVNLFLSENKKNPALNLNLRFGTIGNLVHLLITFHHIHLLKFVLTKHCEQVSPLFDERNQRGLTPVMLAAYLGEEEALVLLKDKVNLEGTDFLGRTAVHHAVLGRQKKSLAYLHSFGVNLMALDANNRIPLSLLDGVGDSESQSVVGYLSNLCKLKSKTQHALPNFVVDPPENLVFKGDDPTGLAYLGVIKALEMKGKINGIRRVAGPSTGALIATLFAIGYSFEEIASEAKFFSSFFDSPIADQAISAIPKGSPHLATLQRLRDIIQQESPLGKDQFKNLHQLPSLCSGKALLDWIEERIYEKTGIHDCTFGELKKLAETNPRFKHLTIFTTCFGSTLMPSRFSSEDVASDEIVISHAVCAALAVPGIFPLKSLYSKNKAGGVDERLSLGLHGDAGPINNFSIEAYDREKYQNVMPLGEEAGEYFRLNKRTLGFALETRVIKRSIPETVTVHQFLEEVLNIYCQMDPSMQQQSTLYNRSRVVQIQNQSTDGVSTLSLAVQIKRVIDAGEESTVEFFEEQARAASSLSPFLNRPERTNQGIKWTNLKSPLPYFVGRTHQINTLKERLIPEHVNPSTTSSSSSSSSSTSRPPDQKRKCIVLAGAGGMGKSETVIAFAHQYRDSFSVVWWIETATPQSMDRSFRQLAEVLEIYIEPTSSAETVRRRIYHFLETENLGKPYLLIFDNAEEVIELPQCDKGCVLITTTQPIHFSMENILPIEPLTQVESISLMVGILKQEANEEMGRLAAEVEYLPAILSQSAQYIRTTPGMTLHKYLEFLSKEKIKVLSMMPVDARYSKTQLSTWRMTHETLMQNHPIAYEWLEICAHLQPDAIPSSYLETWLECFKGEQSYVDRTIKKNQILRTLVNAGILRYDQKSDSYSLHRIRQEMIKQLAVELEATKTENRLLSSSSSSAQERFDDPSKQKAISLLATIVNHLDVTDDWLAIVPHEIQVSTILYKINHETDGNAEIASINHFLGLLYLVRELGREAAMFFRQALAIRTRILPIDHPDTARTLDCLSRANWEGSKREKHQMPMLRMNYLKQAHKMRKRLYQGDHPEIAACLIGRANLYDEFILKGKSKGIVFDKLESGRIKYLTQAMEMLRRLYPNGHPFIASTLICDARHLMNSDRFEDAYCSAIEALQMLERIHSGNNEEHSFILGEVSELLADIAKKKERNDEAVSYYKKALNYYKKAFDRYRRPLPGGKDLGKYFRPIVHCYCNISEILRAQESFSEACYYYEKIIENVVKENWWSEDAENMVSLIMRLQRDDVSWTVYEKIFNVVVGINPNSAVIEWCFETLMGMRFQRCDCAKLITLLTQYIDSHNVNRNAFNIAIALFHRGRINIELGEYASALEQFKEFGLMVRKVKELYSPGRPRAAQAREYYQAIKINVYTLKWIPECERVISLKNTPQSTYEKSLMEEKPRAASDDNPQIVTFHLDSKEEQEKCPIL